jgi:antagonist of KipI
MSLEIVKTGLHDTVQDEGRFGFQHLGINPSGAMDNMAMKIANALVGNNLNEAVLELCFPSSQFVFHEPALIALSGANFKAVINDAPVPMHQLIRVSSGSVLKFTKKLEGSFCYLAMRGGFQIEDWLGSKSTNTKVKAGGWKGRVLQKGDSLSFAEKISKQDEMKVYPWRADISDFYSITSKIRCIRGNEFSWLEKESQADLIKIGYMITRQSDRMGYRLSGKELQQASNQQLLSAAVTFGTIQVLPNGQLIVLCADHQTTGGYPRVAQVVRADLPTLVQKGVGEEIHFVFIKVEEAEQEVRRQMISLKQLQISCMYKLKSILHIEGLMFSK